MVPVFRTLGRVISVRRLEEAVQSIEVVDDAPAAAALLDLGAPSFESRKIFARIEIVRLQLRHVECHDLKAFEFERNVAHITLGQIIFHVGEDQNLLAARLLLVQELYRLQQASGNVGEGSSLRLIDELLYAAGERALLQVRGARTVVERGL